VTAVCPCCGAADGAVASPVLLAVCDVLVVKALEKLGGWIVRYERSRSHEARIANLPLHQAHTRWQVTDDIVDKALKGAWDVIPAMLTEHGCCGVTAADVTSCLDEYVHDLAVAGWPHALAELHYRFETRLHLPVIVVVLESSHG
jgi:hypothetical protein